MTPDDETDADAFVTVGSLRQPLILLALVSLMIMAIGWIVVTSGDLTIPAAWTNGK